MKKTYYAIIPLALVAFLNSCAPVYMCGDSIPEKMPAAWSKKMKTVVSERDTLCTNLANKEEENVRLQNTISDLTAQYNSCLHEMKKTSYSRFCNRKRSYPDRSRPGFLQEKLQELMHGKFSF